MNIQEDRLTLMRKDIMSSNPECGDLCMSFHSGQVDKGGEPYWVHPFSVASMVKHKFGGSKLAVDVALLHDSIEDCGVSPDFIKLLENSVSQETIDCVKILTKKPNMSYFDYILSIIESQNQTCIMVKLCDLLDNSNPQRRGFSARQYKEKYLPAKLKMLNALRDV